MERMRRVLSMLLAVAMVISLCPVTAFAEEAEVLESGDYLYTVLDDGTVSLCGYTGPTREGTESVCLELPDEIGGAAVTEIAQKAFAGADADAILIPESVVKIEDSASGTAAH